MRWRLANAPSGARAEAILHNAIITAEPTPLRELAPEVSPRLAAIIDKCLEKDRERRYRSAAEMRASLKAAKPEAKSDGSTSFMRRRRKLLVAAAVILVTLVAGAPPGGNGAKPSN